MYVISKQVCFLNFVYPEDDVFSGFINIIVFSVGKLCSSVGGHQILEGPAVSIFSIEF